MDRCSPVRPWEIGLVLVALCALGWVGLNRVNADWMNHLETPLDWTSRGVSIWQQLQAGNGLAPHEYPPGQFLVSAAFYSVFGFSMSVAMFSQIIFLVPYIAGCWWIGRELGGRGGGVLTLLAAAGNPWMALHLSESILEIGVSGLVALALALLLASRAGRVPGPSLALGVVLGLGMLTKWSFGFFMAMPVLWPVWLAWREKGSSRKLAAISLACLPLTLCALKSAIPEAQTAFPWIPYLFSLSVWLLLAAAAWRCWRTEGWNAGAATALAWSIGFTVCSWFYFLSIGAMQAKALDDLSHYFIGTPSWICLYGPLATCCVGAMVWLGLGVLVGLSSRDLRGFTLSALGAILLPLGFYVYTRAPTSTFYMLPATVPVLALSFGWWGRVRFAPVVLAPLLLVLGVVGLGSWTQASPGKQPPVSMDDVIARALFRPRLVIVPPPDLGTTPAGATAVRVLTELGRLGEERLTVVLPPGWHPLPNSLFLEAATRGRFLQVRESHVDLRQEPLPEIETSLVVVLEGPEPMTWPEPWQSRFELLERWDGESHGWWSLHRRFRERTEPLASKWLRNVIDSAEVPGWMGARDQGFPKRGLVLSLDPGPTPI